MKYFSFSILLLAVAISSCEKKQKPLVCANVYAAMKKAADWQLSVLQNNKWKYPCTDWTNGALYAGIMAWSSMANDDKYLSFIKTVADSIAWRTGDRRYFADDYCVGQTWSQCFMIYKDSAMIKPMMKLADEIIERPHEESLDLRVIKDVQQREWAWCDALFMGPTALAYLATASGKQKYLDIANTLWWRTADYLYNPKESLFYRDSNFFDRKEKNGQPVFWSRGNGWVIAAITRMLQNMPKDYPDRGRYEKLYGEMIQKIASLQTKDGSWHPSLLDPDNFPKEVSGTAFFCYAMAWGINNGYLEYEEYFPKIQKAWNVIEGCIHEDGKLGNVQVPAASPDGVSDDDTEVYGVGAMLLAGTEIFKLQFAKEEGEKFTVQNTTAVNRAKEVVSIDMASMGNKKTAADSLTVINAQTGEEVPSQAALGNGKTELLVQAGTAINSSAFYFIKNQKPKAVEPKVYGRFVPERKDDFTWENDCIAFRMYGPALEETVVSSGIDVWVKRTQRMVIDKWYKEDNYHQDNGEGMDGYGVGKTLGAGGSAPLINKKLYPSRHFATYKVLEKGPLRFSFQLIYKAWKAGDIEVKETKTITLEAGSFMNKMESTYSFATDELPVAVGVGIMPSKGEVWNETQDYTAFGYQQQDESGNTRIGVVVPQPCVQMQLPTEPDSYKNLGNHLLLTKTMKDKTFTYYQGASWDKEGTFKTFADWQQYLRNKITILKNPLKIKVN